MGFSLVYRFVSCQFHSEVQQSRDLTSSHDGRGSVVALLVYYLLYPKPHHF